MTEPFRPDDELVAAVLDGEATPEERARVEADPGLSARLAEFRAVRDLVAGPVPVAADADRERAIAAAKVAVRHQPKVIPLAARRRQGLPQFLASAAAVVVVLLAVGLLASKAGDDSGDYAGGGGDDSGESESGDQAGGAESASDELAGDGASEEQGDDGDAVSDGPGDQVLSLDEFANADLGRLANENELRSALERDAGDDTAGTSPESTVLTQPAVPASANGASRECQAGLDEVDPGLSGLLVQATADYAGTPAVVYVFGTATGGQRVVVVSMEGCRTLATFDL